MPRTRIPTARQQLINLSPSTASINDLNTEIISPWSRFNNQQYSNDEPESNVVYHTTTLR